MYYCRNLFVQTLFYFNTQTSLPFVCIELQSWCSTVRFLSKMTLILEVNMGLAPFRLTWKNFQISSANAAPPVARKVPSYGDTYLADWQCSSPNVPWKPNKNSSIRSYGSHLRSITCTSDCWIMDCDLSSCLQFLWFVFIYFKIQLTCFTKSYWRDQVMDGGQQL
jgi:hypothetical protein